MSKKGKRSINEETDLFSIGDEAKPCKEEDEPYQPWTRRKEKKRKRVKVFLPKKKVKVESSDEDIELSESDMAASPTKSRSRRKATKSIDYSAFLDSDEEIVSLFLGM